MSAGVLTMPVVVRISVGAKYGASTRRISPPWSPMSRAQVVYPVTPYDAKGMMNSALVGTDPVIFFESRSSTTSARCSRPTRTESITRSTCRSLGQTGRHRPHIVTLGRAVHAVTAADELAERFGVSAEIVDLRSATR